MGKNKENAGRQQGPTDHAPGQHGRKTISRLEEIAHSGKGADAEKLPKYDPEKIARHDDKGRDRLFENREQHDEADINSEKTRLSRDLDRHNHDRDIPSHKRSKESIAKRKS